MVRSIGEIADDISKANTTLAQLGAELILATTGALSTEELDKLRSVAARFAPRPGTAVAAGAAGASGASSRAAG